MKKWLLAIVFAGIFVLSACANNVEDGMASLEARKYEEAKKFFGQEVEREKNLDEAYRGLGIACFELEDYEEAIEAFQRALENGTDETAILYSIMGACYMKMEEYDKALDVYTKALSVEDIAEETKQEIQYNLIAVYENMADWDAAKKQMEQYQKDYPDDKRVEKEADFLETR